MRFKRLLFPAFILSSVLPFVQTQDKSPIIIVPKNPHEVILAVADAQPASAELGKTSDMLKTFDKVLWDDLSFSGFFRMAGKSYYPARPIARPEDVDYESWNKLPESIDFLAVATMNRAAGAIRLECRIFDLKLHAMIHQREFSGDAGQIRTIAHQWADHIVYRLSAGASRGIASTRIAYASKQGEAREIFLMDYDGYNQQQFTRNNSSNYFPNWAPDNSKLAFQSRRSGVWEINIYSLIDGSRLKFPEFISSANSPAISPDGNQIAFWLRTPRGDGDLFISKLDGGSRRDITNNPALDYSPAWAPSGRQLAFISDRDAGVNKIYICDEDGSNIRTPFNATGYVDSPAWSPDGRWIVFQWRPRSSANFDIFLGEAATGKIFQLTSGHGNNQNPSWAPDGRHLAFESDRMGSSQIYIMLLDGSEPLMVTNQGDNTNPAWSGYHKLF
jgi:TolB protein